MSAVLKAISDGMDALALNYDFKKWKGKPIYPYWVGEYQEVPSPNEDGREDVQFILTGFARGENASEALEDAKQKIKEYFPSVGGRRAITESGSAVAIFYAGSFDNLPTGDAELEKIQINLDVKEWRVK